MLFRFVDKRLSALHAEAFVPAGDGVPHQLLHVVEHRLFFHPALRALEDAVVRHEGWAEYSGLRLSITVPPQKCGELVAALEQAFADPLPPLSREERERFAREMELGGGGDFSGRALDAWRGKFAQANAPAGPQAADEDAVWEAMRPAEARVLLVGDKSRCAGVPAEAAWEPREREFVFPDLNGELPLPPPRKQAGFADGADDGFESPEPEGDYEPLVPEERLGCRYAMVLPSRLAGPREYAAHALAYECARVRLTEQYSDAGRTYDPIAFHRWENGFVVSVLGMDTSDAKVRAPKFPKCPKPEEFSALRDALAFQLEIDEDRLVLDGCTSAGLLPKERAAALRDLTLGQFSAAWEDLRKRASILWAWD